MEMEAITRAARLGRTLGELSWSSWYREHHHYELLGQYHYRLCYNHHHHHHDYEPQYIEKGLMTIHYKHDDAINDNFDNRINFCLFVFGNDNFDIQAPATEWSALCWTDSWERWRTTWPALRRCSDTSSTPSPPRSASSTPSPLALLHMDETSSNRPEIVLAIHTLQQPLYPAVQSNPVHYVNLNVIMTAIVFHRISNCWYMLSIVFCSGQLFGKRMWGFLKNQGGFFSHLCIKSRIVVGFWDFWELFLSPCAIFTLNVFSSIFVLQWNRLLQYVVIKRIKQVNKNTFISSNISTSSCIFFLVVLVLFL